MLELSFTLIETLLKYCSACIPSPTSSKILKDPHLINIKHCCNHEERKIKLITCKQQNITKTKNTTNAKQRHPQTLHDDQLSLVLALSIIPKYCNPSSTRSHLHQNLYLGHVHIKNN
jgi:hypothetical protein